MDNNTSNFAMTHNIIPRLHRSAPSKRKQGLNGASRVSRFNPYLEK